VDDAVRRVLEMKQKLGLFERPYADARTEPPFYLPESLTLARQCAAESVVLLKNNGVLPLRRTPSTIAVTGPLADAPADQLGTWVFDGEPAHSVTPLQAIRAACGEKIRVISAPGLAHSRDKDPDGIKRAVDAAEAADVILFFGGEEAILSGEAHSRADISLPGAQGDLLKALKATGKPVVLVVMSGRPNTLTREAELADALLVAFHGGTMAGPALADVIFGDTVPSGKLPVTMPRMVGQIPIYHAHKSSGRPPKDIVLMDDIPVGAGQTSLGCTSYHLDAGDGPLFPFGHGLSYTTFDYGEVSLSATDMPADSSISATCRITNTGSRDAHEIVQLYVRDVVGSLARPVRELKGFEKIFLKAGESRVVRFTLTESDLAFWHGDMTRRAEPGEFHVWISPDSRSGRPVSFRLR
jgi:beta-glucosidase